jgi:hypothetical protein
MKGVCFAKREEKWQARYYYDGGSLFIGYFATEYDANIAYLETVIRVNKQKLDELKALRKQGNI